MAAYRLEAGRAIVRESDGAALFTLHRIGNDSEGYTVAPWEADRFAHAIVAALNHSAEPCPGCLAGDVPCPFHDPLEIDEDTPTVSICTACAGGVLVPLGTLGARTHYRCRDCGMDSSRD